jgi:hypothetical protein
VALISRSEVSPSEAEAQRVVVPLRQEEPLELSVVMPCLNEEETLAACIRKAQRAIADANIAGEVIVADNGSTDRSIEIAAQLGARVVRVNAKGYGNALMGGIAASRGQFIVMGDADDSYDFGHVPRFVEELRRGSDLVMGNRFRGGIQKGAMPALHRYLGNPILTKVGRVLFRSSAGDFHCGLRAFRKDAYERMGLRTTGMWARTRASTSIPRTRRSGRLDWRTAEIRPSPQPTSRTRAPSGTSWANQSDRTLTLRPNTNLSCRIPTVLEGSRLRSGFNDRTAKTFSSI